MRSPRLLVLALFLAACGGSLRESDAFDDLATNVRLRVVAANLSSGNNQNYNAGEGLRILRGLHAGVAMVQEFNYNSNSSSDIQNFASTICGAGACYVA